MQTLLIDIPHIPSDGFPKATEEVKAGQTVRELMLLASSVDKKELATSAKTLWKRHANTIWGILGIFWYCLKTGHQTNAGRCVRMLQKRSTEMDGHQVHFYQQCMASLRKAGCPSRPLSLVDDDLTPPPFLRATPGARTEVKAKPEVDLPPEIPVPVFVCKEADFKRIVDTEQEDENRKQLETMRPLLHLKTLGKVTGTAISGIDRLMEEHPNMVEALGFILGELRARLLADAPAKLPPLLLCGRPGTGKTRLVSEIARIMGLPYTEIQLAGSSDALKITGLSRYWRSAGCGLIARTFCDHEHANPIFIFDEIDKAGSSMHGNPLDAVLLLLEENTAKAFRDEFVTAPIDASHASFMATANSTDSLPAPLLSRFIVIEVPDLTYEGRIKVTTSIYRQLRVSEPYGRFFALTPSSEIVEAMARDEMLTPRLVRQHLKLAMQQACRLLTRAPHPGSLALGLSDLPNQATRSKTRIGFVS
jgi:ATP-dependent Lon protease